MSQQPCYLRIGGDTPAEAVYCRSIKSALAKYEKCARELDAYGQAIGASVHFVDKRGDEPAEYPDRILSLGPLGGLVMSNT